MKKMPNRESIHPIILQICLDSIPIHHRPTALLLPLVNYSVSWLSFYHCPPLHAIIVWFHFEISLIILDILILVLPYQFTAHCTGFFSVYKICNIMSHDSLIKLLFMHVSLQWFFTFLLSGDYNLCIFIIL